MALSWSEAIAKGIVTPAQRRKALLTPTPDALRRKLSISPPQDMLTDLVEHEWPGESVANFQPLLPEWEYQIDIAFPALKFGIEVDGYRSHGLSKTGFKRDRFKDKLFLLAGWRVLRIVATEVPHDLPGLLETIRAMRRICADADDGQ